MIVSPTPPSSRARAAGRSHDGHVPVGPARATHGPGRVALLAPVASALLALLLTGCGATPAAAPSASAPTSAPAGTTTSTPTTTPAPTGGTTAGTLIWPVRDTAAAAELQQAVDGGSQPWLLDPAGVATSYAGAELGYRDPHATQAGTGVVEVRDGTGPTAATITLTQPARRGDGGIWIVTGVRRR